MSTLSLAAATFLALVNKAGPKPSRNQRERLRNEKGHTAPDWR